MSNFDQPGQKRDVGEKPPAVPGETHNKSESLLHRLQDEMTQVPTGVFAAAGFIVGLSARLPGEAGYAGKAAAAILGAATIAHAVDRGVESHRDTNTKAYEGDAAFLTALGGGILLPNLWRSESSISMGREAVKDAAKYISLNTERSSMKIARGAIDTESLRHIPVTKAQERSADVIDFGKYAEIYRKGESKMITEEQIGKFPPETQETIRKEIKDMMANGYDQEYLMLGHDGEVMLDHDAAETGAFIKASQQAKKEP